MRCPYCAATVERQAWFCPECKRSTRRLEQSRPGAARSALLIAGGLGMLGLGYGLSGRLLPAAPQASTEVPRVSIAPMRVSAPSPAPEAPEAEVAKPLSRAVVEKPVDAEPRLAVEVAEAATPILPAPLPTPVGNGAVTVVCEPAERTFVYLNGGKLLGETPLRNAEIPAGRHKLVFWTPSVGGRSARTVDITPGGSLLIVEKVQPQERFSTPGA